MFGAAGLVLVAPAGSGEGSSARFKLSPESRCFEGHFEGLPVLPGVGHLAMVAIAHARRSGLSRPIVGARDLRFQHALGPGDEVDVVLADRADREVRFEIRRSGAVASSGFVTFATQGDDAAG